MPRSISTLRTGEKYRLINHGEVWDFEILDVLGGGEYHLKDLNTLEKYYMSEIIRYGKGKDYSLEEISGGRRMVDRMFD